MNTKLIVGASSVAAVVGALAMRPVEVLDFVLPTAPAAVPEPSTIALFALGAAGLGVAQLVRKRRKD